MTPFSALSGRIERSNPTRKEPTISSEIERLRRQNKLLRAGNVDGAALALAGVMSGMGDGPPPRPKPVSIASDGEHLFRMNSDGQIYVLPVKEQLVAALLYEENRRKSRGRQYVKRPRAHWVLFVENF